MIPLVIVDNVTLVDTWNDEINTNFEEAFWYGAKLVRTLNPAWNLQGVADLTTTAPGPIANDCWISIANGVVLGVAGVVVYDTLVYNGAIWQNLGANVPVTATIAGAAGRVAVFDAANSLSSWVDFFYDEATDRLGLSVAGSPDYTLDMDGVLSIAKRVVYADPTSEDGYRIKFTDIAGTADDLGFGVNLTGAPKKEIWVNLASNAAAAANKADFVWYAGTDGVVATMTQLGILESKGLKMVDGTEALGFLLTSDASGNGTWIEFLGGGVQGDIIQYDAVTGWTQLALGAATEILQVNAGVTALEYVAQPSGSGDDRWQTWAGASRTTDATITSATNIEAGTPVRFRAAAGTWRYAYVVLRVANVHTVAGHSCTLADDDEFEYGVQELLHTEVITVPGAFADATNVAATATGLLYTDLLMKLHYIWRKSAAYIVQIGHVCVTADATVDPTIDINTSTDNIAYSNIFGGSSVTTTLTETTTAAIAGDYDLFWGDYIEFDITKLGTGDARDLTIFLTIVME